MEEDKYLTFKNNKMDNNFCNKRIASWKAVVFFAFGYAIAIFIMNRIISPISSADFVKAELSRSYAVKIFTVLSDKGLINKFIYGLFWDYVYMLGYGGLLFSLIMKLACLNNLAGSKIRALALTAFYAVMLDVMENIFEFLFILNIEKPGVLPTVATIFSWLKWLTVLLAITIIFYLIVRKLTTKK